MLVSSIQFVLQNNNYNKKQYDKSKKVILKLKERYIKLTCVKKNPMIKLKNNNYLYASPIENHSSSIQ